MTMQMIIGDFPFSTSTAEYGEVRRVKEYRWLQRDRLNRKPALQFQGVGLKEVTLTGVIHIQSYKQLEHPQQMEAIADKGDPLNLLASNDTLKADYLGQWVIMRLEFVDSDLMADGTPETITFTMTIKEYGEDDDL
ncbi:hypothetical protein AB835_11620 [Candidatus Endobugula sertula]|uniref:Phage tail protein n=1 Tax=Candidatus Endobugula sertula TaxID=62101 RepID=A0A1D2QMV0_9GAMM|nr:hypothetical protein AB835_11620 [Candidatus Endobugula sertula]